MIPTILSIDEQKIKKLQKYDKTFKLTDKRIIGYIDNINSIKQMIYKTLSTQRYKYLCYDWSYGIEISDLIGKPKYIVTSELPRRIIDALLIDNRIKNIKDFIFNDISMTSLQVTFTVITYDFNEIEIEGVKFDV